METREEIEKRLNDGITNYRTAVAELKEVGDKLANAEKLAVNINQEVER